MERPPWGSRAVDAPCSSGARAQGLVIGLARRLPLAHVARISKYPKLGLERTLGEYRTQRVILEIYDAMAEAMRTGKPYQTRLDPPPADPRVAHPDTRRAPVQGKSQGRA